MLLSAGLAAPVFAAQPAAGDTTAGQPAVAGGAAAGGAADKDRAEEAIIDHFASDVKNFSTATNNFLRCWAHECYARAKKEVADSSGQIKDPQKTPTYQNPKACVAHFKSFAEKFNDFDKAAIRSKGNPDLLKDDAYRNEILNDVTAFNTEVDNRAARFKDAKALRKSANAAVSVSRESCGPDSDLPDLMESVPCESCVEE
jgi:hypothetical protein